MDTYNKQSYKKIVIEGSNSDNVQPVKELKFSDYEDVVIPSFTRKTRNIGSQKRELLIDMLSDIANTTSYVKERFGFHGIADELKLEDVLNAFEKSLKVEVYSDNDCEQVSEEDPS
jgi:hypothetical protein